MKQNNYMKLTYTGALQSCLVALQQVYSGKTLKTCICCLGFNTFTEYAKWYIYDSKVTEHNVYFYIWKKQQAKHFRHGRKTARKWTTNSCKISNHLLAHHMVLHRKTYFTKGCTFLHHRTQTVNIGTSFTFSMKYALLKEAALSQWKHQWTIRNI